MNAGLDNHDEKILLEQIALWDKRRGPRVGDWCLLLDGTARRFTHDWGDFLQTTTEPAGKFGASFYFGKGYMEFSGGLDRAINAAEFELTEETRDGSCWFFHHGEARAYNGIQTNVPCRVYKQRVAEQLQGKAVL